MNDLRKRNIVLRVFFFATIMLSMAAVASAQVQGSCSPASVAGTWGYTDTGTLITPNGPVPFAAVGTITVDADGNFTGTQTSSAGGNVVKNAIKGTGTVNADCTGTATVRVYDELGTTPLRTATFFTVFVDNAREEREIATSLAAILPDGTSVPVPAVITGTARKLFPPRFFFFD
jgi:hypothetical protein